MNTIREAYQKASSFLQKNNSQDPHFEAEWLLREALGWQRDQLFTRWEEPLTRQVWSQLEQWLLRRVKGEPLQYIVGKQNFYGRDFTVNSSVLIPRSETEELVEKVLHEAQKQWTSQPIHVVDVGTGSGAIAITLALESPEWRVTAMDLSSDALSVAKKNADALRVLHQVKFLQGDLLLPILETNDDFSILVSNPPYIASEVCKQLEIQVRDFEPHLALDGGNDGLDYYRQLKAQLIQLPPRRRLVAFEIGFDQGKAVANLFASLATDKQTFVEQDIAGLDRIVWFWMADSNE